MRVAVAILAVAIPAVTTPAVAILAVAILAVAILAVAILMVAALAVVGCGAGLADRTCRPFCTSARAPRLSRLSRHLAPDIPGHM